MTEGSVPIWQRLANDARIVFLLARERGAAYRPLASIERVRDRRVRSMVRYAWRHVPFYRQTMRRLGLKPGDFRTADDLAKLPFVDPRDIHLDLEYYTAQGVDRRDWLALESSGSTGTSRTVLLDQASVIANAAHGLRDREVALGRDGPTSGYREVYVRRQASGTVRTQSFVACHTWLPPGRRVKRLYLDMEEEAGTNLRCSLEFGADMVSAYGSYVNDMAAALSRSEGSRKLPFGFVVTSEAVSTEARNYLVKACGARLVSVYGAVEALKVGFSCEQWTGIHQNADLCHLRMVDDDGADVPTGEPGEVVVSNLINRATVLLNYRLKDRARWLGTPCPCGRTLPLLSFPEGRVCDWVILRDGRRLHSAVALSLVQDLAGVLEFQVTQRAVDDFEVLLVPDGRREWAAMEAETRSNFRRRLGDDAQVTVRQVEHIRREENGKRRLWVVLPGVGE